MQPKLSINNQLFVLNEEKVMLMLNSLQPWMDCVYFLQFVQHF